MVQQPHTNALPKTMTLLFCFNLTRWSAKLRIWYVSSAHLQSSPDKDLCRCFDMGRKERIPLCRTECDINFFRGQFWPRWETTAERFTSFMFWLYLPKLMKQCTNYCWIPHHASQTKTEYCTIFFICDVDWTHWCNWCQILFQCDIQSVSSWCRAFRGDSPNKSRTRCPRTRCPIVFDGFLTFKQRQLDW